METPRGIWRCTACGEMTEVWDRVPSADWRCTGEGWEHHHPSAQWHIDAERIDPVATIKEYRQRANQFGDQASELRSVLRAVLAESGSVAHEISEETAQRIQKALPPEPTDGTG